MHPAGKAPDILSVSPPSSHTLNGRLGTGSSDSTESADHEVLEHLVGAGRVGAHVVAPVGDVVALLGALERARVGRGRGIAELGGGANGADVAGVALSRDAAREGAGGNGERRHR